MQNPSYRQAVTIACILTVKSEFRQSLVANTDETEEAGWLAASGISILILPAP